MKGRSILKILIVISLVFLTVSIVSSDDLSDSDVETSLTDDSVDSVNLEDADSDKEELSADGGANTVEDNSKSADDTKLDESQSKDKSTDSKSKDDNSASSSNSANEDDGEFPDCNIVITKKGDKKVKVGDEVEWTITVNNSLNTAYNVHVDEKFPKNFKLISANASQGEYNKEMNYWEVGDLKENKSATLIIKAKALKAGEYTNKVDLITDSKNINGDEITAKADVKVVDKEKAGPAKKKKQQKTEGKKKATKNNQTNSANATNSTNNTAVNLKGAGGSLFAVIVSSLAVLGVFLGRRRT